MDNDSMEASPAYGDCGVCGNLTPKDGWYQSPGYSKHVTMLCLTTSADAGCKYCTVILGAVNWAWDAYLRVCPEVSPVFVPLIFVWNRPDRPFTVVVDYHGARDRSGPPAQYYRWLVALEFCTPEGFAQFHPRFSYIPGVPKYPASLDLEKLVSIVNPWLKQCDRDHLACQQKSFTVPKRLIDLSGNMRLVERGPHVDGDKLVKYATLSHCWGSKEAASSLAKTMSTNIQQHLTAISRYDLPQLFRDAIDIARALGCGFIWIDALCIIQDSPQDWREQSVLMGDVYSNAYLNIAASALPNSSGTLFQDRVCYWGSKRRYSTQSNGRLPIDTYTEWVFNGNGVQSPVTVRYSMDRAHRHLCGEAMHEHGTAEPLLDRAWVFQERMLSRRTVYISSSEVLWECRSRYFCECGGINNPIASGVERFDWEVGHLGPLRYDVPYYTPSSKKVVFADVCSSKLSSKEALAFWRTMIQEYTMLILTRESDRDIALSGIRQSFMTGRDFTYYAGIWIQDLPQSLLWAPGLRVSPLIKAEEGMDAPSWSWLWHKGKGGQEIIITKIAWDRYDLESFEKDSRVSFHVPDDAYQRFYNQPLIAPTLGHFPLHLTAPFLHGLLEPRGPDYHEGFPSMSFPDDGPVTDRIKGYGGKLEIMVVTDHAILGLESNWDTPGRRAYCVLLGYAATTPVGYEMLECMLLLEEIPSPIDERRYVRTGLVHFLNSPSPPQNGEEDDWRGDDWIERTNLFEDARVKEFIIV